ncbi:MAG TPA: type IV pilin protein [Steroidobacteraceae bacterium]|jgi:type IV pilus assembly protein PilE|nr:type IV pilin protein [Steroidobacteraceae bacterium]
MRNRQRGVTLIELMTVVIVVAILASVAIPSYRRYLLRAQRSDATTMLLRVATAEEKRYLQQGAYTTNLASAPPTGLGLATRSDQGFYDLDVTLTSTGFTARARPVSGGGQSADTTCASFTVTETGTRKALNSSSVDKTSECWR